MKEREVLTKKELIDMLQDYPDETEIYTSIAGVADGSPYPLSNIANDDGEKLVFDIYL